MNDIRCEREKVFPEIISSSFANIAISARLHSLPQRFFWSGVETFYDIIHLLRNIKSGKHPLIEKESIIDIFYYSVGAFLAEILMLSNTGNYFDNAKLFIFAGGPVFNRMSPVSKYIIDSKANMAIYSFFIEHLENHLKKDKRLAHYFGESHPEGKVFKCMLNYNKMKSFREEKIRSMSERIEAIALSKDTVVPPYEVINTLKGESRKIPVKVRIIDFPYFYCHENPFPINEKNIIGVNNSFNRVMRYAANFLK